MISKKAQTAWDVKLSADKRHDFTEWLCTELENAQEARSVPVPEVQYWWKLYQQDRTRANAPFQDAADLTSYLGTEKVDSLLARVMRTIFVDPFYTVEGWGQSAKKAPFVEEFHQWQIEAEGLQTFVERALLQALIEPRGVLEVYEDVTERVKRTQMRALVQATPDVPFMLDADMEPVLATGEDGKYVEATDPNQPSAEVVVDERERARKGPAYRVIGYRDFLVLPGHAREKADIFGYAKRFTKRVDQLTEAGKAGTYDRDAIEKLTDSSDVVTAETVSGLPVPVAPQDGPTAEKELWEVQLLHDVDGKGMRWYVATVHLGQRVLLRLKHDSVNRGRFITFVPFPRVDRAHEGYSLIGHKLITTIEEHTAVRNMSADRSAMVIAAPIKRMTGALWDPDLQPWGPKAVIDVRDMKEIEPMSIPDVPPSMWQREQELVSASERIVGVNDVALGQRADAGTTLGETEIRTEQSFVRMDLAIKNLQESLEELGQVRNEIWKNTLRDMGEQGMSGPEDLMVGLEGRGGDVTQGQERPITADLLEGTFRFKPRGSTETADKAKQRADYVQFMQALPMMMQMWPAMGAKLANNPEAAASALEQLVRLFNMPDKQAWIGTLSIQPPAPQMPGLPGAPGDSAAGGPPLPPGLPPELAAMMGGMGGA